LIPFIQLPSLHLPFGLEISPFSVMVAIGLLTGASLAARAARTYGPGDDSPLRDVVPWALIGGLVGAHLMHVLAYHPELLREQGFWVLFKFWDGISSMGGVIGALAGIGLFFHQHRLKLRPYLDALALGTAPGWAFARIGCFLVHDHPGIRTNFPLAVAFPGGARHDLGLYDVFVLAILSAILYWVARRRPAEGTLMAILAIGYSVPRFFLDFLRATDYGLVDGRILGLTPAQYVAPLLVATGIWLLIQPSPRREEA
jgi:phosphatidylglycerol:prolipoprotein diacylglycerol transferase